MTRWLSGLQQCRACLPALLRSCPPNSSRCCPLLPAADNMQVWGWRIPFLLAFGTAILGFYLRSSLPEPKAFLRAARLEKELEAKQQMADGEAAVAGAITSAPSAKRWVGRRVGSCGGCLCIRKQPTTAATHSMATWLLHPETHCPSTNQLLCPALHFTSSVCTLLCAASRMTSVWQTLRACLRRRTRRPRSRAHSPSCMATTPPRQAAACVCA